MKLRFNLGTSPPLTEVCRALHTRNAEEVSEMSPKSLGSGPGSVRRVSGKCRKLSAPKMQRFLRFVIAMPIADPRNRYRFPKQEKAMLHCDLRVRWKVASDLRFRTAISRHKTPSFCGISGDLAQSTRKSLAIAVVRFWCAKVGRVFSKCSGDFLETFWGPGAGGTGTGCSRTHSRDSFEISGAKGPSDTGGLVPKVKSVKEVWYPLY